MWKLERERLASGVIPEEATVQPLEVMTLEFLGQLMKDEVNVFISELSRFPLLLHHGPMMLVLTVHWKA